MRKNFLMGAIVMLSCGGVVAGDLLSESFDSAPLPKGWVFYKEPWKLEQAPDPKDNPAWGDEKFLTVAPDTRWNTPAFKCEPFKYYKMTFKSKAKSDNVALQSNLDKSARSKLDRSGSWEMEDYERERTMFGRAMEEGEVAV